MTALREWLDSLGLGKFNAAFEREDISLRHIPELTEDDLRDLGLPMGRRKALPTWPRNRTGRPPRQSRRNRPRSGPTADGRKTHDPASAASPTSLPSSPLDDPSAVPSPSANPPVKSEHQRIRQCRLRQRAVERSRLFAWVWRGQRRRSALHRAGLPGQFRLRLHSRHANRRGSVLSFRRLPGSRFARPSRAAAPCLERPAARRFKRPARRGAAPGPDLGGRVGTASTRRQGGVRWTTGGVARPGRADRAAVGG